VKQHQYRISLEHISNMIPWDERYGAADYYYGTEANEFLREHWSVLPRGGDVLCLAEGEGRTRRRSS
jgi:hypothetical protein